MNYLVNEVFLTIQGEATFTGTPAVFVRLQGCRVGCAFCDTKHTWKTDHADLIPVTVMLRKSNDAPTHAAMTAAEVTDVVSRCAEGARHVVITGGEPADHLLDPLVHALDGEGFRVQIETSGTSQLALEAPAFVTVSPKINQAGGLRVLREVIGRADEIKHPCSTERHLAELQELLALGWHRPEVPVWLQPLSMHPKATERCVQWCKRHGYRLSLQTHRLVSIR